MLQPEWYFLANDALQLNGVIGAEHFPDRFYGVGNRTRREDEERYTPNYYELALNPWWRLARSIYAGPIFRLQRASMSEVEPGGMLAQETIPGSRGGTTVQVGASAVWDTRDRPLNARSGSMLRLSYYAALPALESSFSFSLLRLDARHFIRLPWAKHVLAAQALVELRNGEPPLYELGRLGGPMSMRGYFQGRYRDRQLATAQLEYRAPLFWRVGAVAFASVGNVARDPAGLADSVKEAGGAGLRWAPLARVPVNLRLDLAYGSDLSFYLRLAEAF